MPHHAVTRHAFAFLGLFVAVGPSLPTSADSSVDVITIDPTSRRAIGGVVELDRQTVFNLADHGKEFDKRVDSPERMELLLGELNITFGRELGPVMAVTRWSNAVSEDPQRPGYVDIQALADRLTPPQPGSRFRNLWCTALGLPNFGSRFLLLRLRTSLHPARSRRCRLRRSLLLSIGIPW